MGEAKIKAAKAAQPMTRPTLEIIQMRQAVQVAPAQGLDEDTRDFMRALAALLNWLDHLEKSGELPPVKLDA